MNPPILCYRFGHFLHRLGLTRLAKGWSYVLRLLFGCWLPSSATIGRNCKLGYWGIGIVIHSDAVIGDDCVIAQNVTIGRNLGDTEVPVIGNKVYVGAGSVLFGNIRIGDAVIIGANSVINKSVPDHAIVVGNPARVIGTTEGKSFVELDQERKNHNSKE